jgi:hypothetical protein
MEDKTSLFVRSAYTEAVILRVVDASGRIMFEQKLNNRVGANLHEINTNNLSPGVYFAQFLNGRNVYGAVKLVKARF